MNAEELSTFALRLTEEAAIGASRFIARGDKDAADQAAVDAMRRSFETVPISGTVVIGEGQKDEAPMLYIGEEVGNADEPVVDIAVDPLEGTSLTAKGDRRALTVLAMAPKDSFLNAPDVYMMKLAAGPKLKGKLDLNDDFEENVRRVAEAKEKDLKDLTCILLERDRNQEYIETLRELDCRVRLIEHGDISAALSTCVPETEVDMLAGIGNSTEGVLSAAAIQCFGGEFQGRFNPIGDAQHERLNKMGYGDLDEVYDIDDLASGEQMVFACTGVTDGDFLQGVHEDGEFIYTNSLVLTYPDGSERTVRGRHHMTDEHREEELPPLPRIPR